jgi:hypothetical protein
MSSTGLFLLRLSKAIQMLQTLCTRQKKRMNESWSLISNYNGQNKRKITLPQVKPHCLVLQFDSETILPELRVS